jgi:hypothetical protein
MRFHIVGAIALAMTAPAYAQTIPSTPGLAAGPEFKGLRLDWEPAAGASWYELEFKANQAASFVQLGGDLPASATSFRYRFPLHLFDWTYARYRLAACNASGCSRSSEVSVSALRRDAVGYFKAAVSTDNMRFGNDTDISPDGLNFVASAGGEIGDNIETGAVYVFRRTSSNGAWVQRARLAPTVPLMTSPDLSDLNVGISADGNTVVVGMPHYIREYVDEEVIDDKNGEVFVFHFNGTSWVRTRLYTGPGVRGKFGHWISINDAGDTIAVASHEQAASASYRHLFIYRLINGTWQPVRDLRSTSSSEFCNHGALSADGSTVVQACKFGTWNTTLRNYVRILSGPNWTVREEVPLELASASSTDLFTIGIATDRTGDTIAAQIAEDTNAISGGPSEVHVFRRNGAYSRVAVLAPGSWRDSYARSFYGTSIALSDDGGTIAVGDFRDNGYGTGPRAAPLDPSTARTGAVYVYRLRGTWRLANMVKPNYATGVASFGLQVTLNGNGQTLLVGDENESSTAQGIGGGWSNTGAPQSGAVWMY